MDATELAQKLARAERPMLSARARTNLRAFAEAYFSRDGSAPPADRLDWLVDDIADFLGQVGGRARFVFGACLFAVSWGSGVLVGRPFSPLRALPIDVRIEAIERVEKAPLVALAFFALRALCSLVYYEHPDAAAEIGWDQRCLKPTARDARELPIAAEAT